MLAMLLVYGCGESRPKGILQAEPRELFSGELKWLAPHVASVTGCVSLRYSGPKRVLRLGVWTWENGKRKMLSGVDMPLGERLNDQIAVTLHDINQCSQDAMYRMVFAYPGGTAEIYLPKVGRSGTNSNSLELPDTANISAGKQLAVWGYAWLEGTVQLSKRKLLPIETRAEEAEWAVVVTVEVVDVPDMADMPN